MSSHVRRELDVGVALGRGGALELYDSPWAKLVVGDRHPVSNRDRGWHLCQVGGQVSSAQILLYSTETAVSDGILLFKYLTSLHQLHVAMNP